MVHPVGNTFTTVKPTRKTLKVIIVVEIEEDDDDYACIERRERERVQNDEQIHMRR